MVDRAMTYRETEWDSMYSDMSILTTASSESNKNCAKVLQSSVLPTPVGPRNARVAIGFEGSDMPALDLWMASATTYKKEGR